MPISNNVELLVSTAKDLVEFGEDVVVVLGYYCFSITKKDILRKGLKRNREGEVLARPMENQFI